jgi:cob(I)alamin adenosyltransferase
VARGVCRRAERLLFKYSDAPEEAIYFNRLSDYLFMAARYACMVTGNTELVYYEGAAGRQPDTSL